MFLLLFWSTVSRGPEDNVELDFFRLVVVSLLLTLLLNNKVPDLRRLLLGLLLALFKEVLDLAVLLGLVMVEERLDLELCTLRVVCLLAPIWVLETFLRAGLEVLDASDSFGTLLTEDCFTGDLEIVAVAYAGASFSSGDLVLGV